MVLFLGIAGVVRGDGDSKNARALEEDLKQALAEADRLDPGWRLEQLAAKRPALPADKNSAIAAQAVRRLLPEKWPALELFGLSEKVSPEVRLSQAQGDLLRRELDKVKPALAQARRLADLPNGRYSIKWAADLISTPLISAETARRCFHLLELEAYRQIQDGDPDGALSSCRGLLNAGRSIGDEPLTLSQLVRVVAQSRAARVVERALAQGQPSENALAAAQALLADEARHPALLVMMRAERVWQHTYLTGLKTGTMKWSDYEGKFETDEPRSPEQTAARDARMAEAARLHHARSLRFSTRAVEIAKQPTHEQLRLFADVTASLKDVPQPARDLLWKPSNLIRGPLWIHAKCQCAVVGLAVERYRREHQRWPASLADVPGLPKEMLTDPLDGRPLRYRRLPDGAVIWSVGLDGKDDGGKLSDNGALDFEGKDIGFRLWDVRHRRRPPQPAEKPPGGREAP
ncbi:MAG TPA: hypothetical protein VFE78_17165 [Gemmataceae bacterium]|nr:hypothetical protein [Gemmataceae bacterium]